MTISKEEIIQKMEEEIKQLEKERADVRSKMKELYNRAIITLTLWTIVFGILLSLAIKFIYSLITQGH